MRVSNYRVPAALGFLLFPLFATAQDAAPVADTGDTAWLITATALVLFMTLPGLALFYAGLVRTKNVLSILIQCFAITCVVSMLWLAVMNSRVKNTDSPSWSGEKCVHSLMTCGVMTIRLPGPTR